MLDTVGAVQVGALQVGAVQVGALQVGAGADAVRAALVADRAAGFATLMDAYQRVVYSVASSFRSNQADAEDLAAESFLKAYRALRGYGAARIRALRLPSWLLAIVRNTARNAARDAARRPAAPPALEPVEQPDPGPTVEEQVERSIEQDRLRAVLARLPETQRAAVVLRHVGELSNSEVGRVLGCPEGTAKSYVSRGLKQLRTMLVDQGQPTPTSRRAVR